MTRSKSFLSTAVGQLPYSTVAIVLCSLSIAVLFFREMADADADTETATT